MMKSVHHVIDFTEVAHRRYWRDHGEQAPMPASGYEAAEHDGKSFVVVSNIDGPLAIYRIDFGVLQTLADRPKVRVAGGWWAEGKFVDSLATFHGQHFMGRTQWPL